MITALGATAVGTVIPRHPKEQSDGRTLTKPTTGRTDHCGSCGPAARRRRTFGTAARKQGHVQGPQRPSRRGQLRRVRRRCSFDTGLHLHNKLEETFYVLEGEFELRAGDQACRALPGTLMFVPPGVPHAFSNPTEAPARLLLLMSPPGHDRYFAALAAILARSGPPDTDAIAALRSMYDTEQLSSLLTSAAGDTDAAAASRRRGS
jgi:mannose-6-phosphate isomerase-like protein (cupin superfamily)